VVCLVEDLHDPLGARDQRRVGEEQRDGDRKSEHRGDHRVADAGRHELGIAGAGLGDDLEGLNHADDRTYEDPVSGPAATASLRKDWMR